MSNNNENGEQRGSILKQRGFIIVLAICIIAVAGVLFATLMPTGETAVDEPAQDVQKSESQTLDEAIEKSAEIKEIFPSTQPQATTAPEASTQPQATSVPKNMQKAALSLQKPIEGEIGGAFVTDKLCYNKTLNMWQTHNGVDIVPSGSLEVKAALAGEVTGVVDDPSMGKTVTIAHSGGVVTKYAGLADSAVAEGDKVQKGDVIGSCGTPPFEAHMGAHLHFEVWENGAAIDPASVFE